MKVKIKPEDIDHHSLNQSAIVIGIKVNISSFIDLQAFDDYCNEVTRQMQEAFKKNG